MKRHPPPGNVRLAACTGDNIRGVVTNKANRIVQHESWHERALMLRFERDPTVVDYESQPEKFEFIDQEGKMHTYVPDFIVWRRNGDIEIHEVSMSERRTRPDIHRRERAAQTICEERGWQYIVHTEHTLPSRTEEANLLALYQYRAGAYANENIARVAYELLADGERMLLQVLVDTIAQQLDLPKPDVVSTIGHMLWLGELETDLERLLFLDGEIMRGVLVWRKSKGEGDDV